MVRGVLEKKKKKKKMGVGIEMKIVCGLECR